MAERSDKNYGGTPNNPRKGSEGAGTFTGNPSTGTGEAGRRTTEAPGTSQNSQNRPHERREGNEQSRTGSQKSS